MESICARRAAIDDAADLAGAGTVVSIVGAMGAGADSSFNTGTSLTIAASGTSAFNAGLAVGTGTSSSGRVLLKGNDVMYVRGDGLVGDNSIISVGLSDATFERGLNTA